MTRMMTTRIPMIAGTSLPPFFGSSFFLYVINGFDYRRDDFVTVVGIFRVISDTVRWPWAP